VPTVDIPSSPPLPRTRSASASAACCRTSAATPSRSSRPPKHNVVNRSEAARYIGGAVRSLLSSDPTASRADAAINGAIAEPIGLDARMSPFVIIGSLGKVRSLMAVIDAEKMPSVIRTGPE